MTSMWKNSENKKVRELDGEKWRKEKREGEKSDQENVELYLSTQLNFLNLSISTTFSFTQTLEDDEVVLSNSCVDVLDCDDSSDDECCVECVLEAIRKIR